MNLHHEALTARERQVAEAITRGLANRQIARECGISSETVKRHLATIYGKLALPSRVALAVHVLQTKTMAIVIAAICLATPATAQVFTPTQAPKARVVEAREELTPVRLEKVNDECALAADLKPERVLDAVKTEAILMRKLFDEARDKLDELQRPKASHHGLDDIYDRLKDAIVDLSVAGRPAQWTASIVKGQSAAARLQEVTFTGVTLDAAETAAFTKSQGNAACAATWLGERAKSGSPLNLGLSTKTFWFLPGAGVTTGDEASDVSLKAAEFYFSNHWRLYVHSTVTVEKAKAKDKDPDAEEAEAETEPDPDEIAESVKSALLNPYGSPLYLTAGYLRKIRTPFFDGDANDADHGLFFDSRLGLKFLTLPEESLELVENQTKSTAFYIGSAALRRRLPLYKEAPFVAGEDGVDVALTVAANRISNPGASKLFLPGEDGSDPLVPKLVYGAHLAIGISLPKMANVVISGTLWSNTKFDRRFQVSINLQKSDTEVPQAKTPDPPKEP